MRVMAPSKPRKSKKSSKKSRKGQPPATEEQKQDPSTPTNLCAPITECTPELVKLLGVSAESLDELCLIKESSPGVFNQEENVALVRAIQKARRSRELQFANSQLSSFDSCFRHRDTGEKVKLGKQLSASHATLLKDRAETHKYVAMHIVFPRYVTDLIFVSQPAKLEKLATIVCTKLFLLLPVNNIP